MAVVSSHLITSLIALLGATSSFAAEQMVADNPTPEPTQDLAEEDAQTSQELFATRSEENAPPSQLASLEAAYGYYLNPNVPLPLDDLSATTDIATRVENFSQLLWNCAVKGQWYGPRFAALDSLDQLGLRNLFRLYAISFARQQGPEAVSMRDLEDLKRCGVMLRDSEGALFRSRLGMLVNDSDDADVDGRQFALPRLDAFLSEMRASRGAAESDLLILYMLRKFPQAFRLDAPRAAALLVQGKEPYGLLLDKTTPSLDFNNFVAGKTAEFISWKALGMNSYTGFGYYQPIHSWIAWAKYDHPVLSSLVPFFSPAFEALDSFSSFAEGKDASGADQTALFSAGLLTLNLVEAALDFPSVKAGAATTYRAVADLSKKARNAKSFTELLPHLKQASGILRATTAKDGTPLGDKALQAWKTLGRPVKTKFAMVNRALGSTIKDSEAFSQIMGKAILTQVRKAGLLRQGKLIMGAQGLYYDTLGALANARGLVPGADPARFGASRFGTNAYGLATSIFDHGPYGRFKDMLIRYAKKGREAKAPAFTSSPEGLEVGQSGWINQTVGTLPNGQKVPMTLVVAYDTPVDTPIGKKSALLMHWSDRWKESATPPPGAELGATALMEEVDDHLANLFEKALDPAQAVTRKEVIDIAAEMHWWLANMTPYIRGSNTIADAMSKVVLRARGVRVGMWKKEVSADFWAFTHDLDDFKSLYPKLFDDGTGALPPDLTLDSGVRQGVAGTTSYPLPMVAASEPLQGKAVLDRTSKPYFLRGYAASRALSFVEDAINPTSSPNSERSLTVRQAEIPTPGGPQVQAMYLTVKVVKTYSDGRAEAVLYVPAAYPSPGDLPATLKKDFANDNAGFELKLSQSDQEDIDNGVLTLKAYAFEPGFAQELHFIGPSVCVGANCCDSDHPGINLTDSYYGACNLAYDPLLRAWSGCKLVSLPANPSCGAVNSFAMHYYLSRDDSTNTWEFVTQYKVTNFTTHCPVASTCSDVPNRAYQLEMYNNANGITSATFSVNGTVPSTQSWPAFRNVTLSFSTPPPPEGENGEN